MKNKCSELCKLQYDCLRVFCEECRGTDAAVYLALMSQDASAVFNPKFTEALYAEYFFHCSDDMLVIISTEDLVSIKGFVNDELVCQLVLEPEDSAMIKRTTKAFWEYMRFKSNMDRDEMPDGNYRVWLFR